MCIRDRVVPNLVADNASLMAEPMSKLPMNRLPAEMCIRDRRKFQWGVQAGVDWKAFKHLKVHADLNWGLNDIFNKDFKTVTFDMYAIYLNVGFGYAF